MTDSPTAENSELQQKLMGLKPGDHLCCIYDTEAEHRSVLTPYMRQGLEKGEKVLYIVDERTSETILDYLQDEGLDVVAYLEKGQLSIVSSSGSYIKEGEAFAPDRMISLLREETGRALEEGYSALRVTGELTWALKSSPGSERLIEYEAKLNTFFSENKCMAVCQYARHRFGSSLLLDVLKTHPIVIIGTQLYDNFYYIDPEDVLGHDPETAQLNNRIRNLERHSRAGETLRESEEKYRTLIENSNMGIVVLQDGKKVYANSQMAEMVGYTDAEFLEVDLISSIHPEDREFAMNRIRQRFERGIMEPELAEIRAMTKSGETIWIETSSAVIQWRGRPALQAFVIDITERKKAEKALKRSEATTRSLLNIPTDFAVLIDTEGKILDLNDTLLNAVQLPRDETIGTSLWDVFPADARKHRKAVMRKALKTKAPVRHEDRIGDSWYDTVLCPILDDQEDVDQIAILSRSITERKKMELELQEAKDKMKARVAERTSELARLLAELGESENRLAEAQRIAGMGSWWWDIISDKTYWSAELYRVLGVVAEDIKPSREAFLERVHTDDRDLLRGKIEAVFSDHESFSIDHRIILPDGSTRYVNSKARIEKDEGNNLLRMFGVCQDITQRKETEEDLKVKESAIASSISGIGMTDTEGTLVYVNDSLVKMWGYDSAEEVIGRHLFEFWDGDEIKKTAEALLTRGSRIGEDIGKRKDGSLMPIQYSATMIMDAAGNPKYMFGSFLDITTKKKAEEELQEKERSLAEAQRIAHLGSWEWNISAGETTWSDEVFRIFGMKNRKKTISGEEFLRMVHADDRQAVEEATKQALEKPARGFDHQYRIVRPDGSVRYVNEYGHVTVDDTGVPIRVLGTTQDITEMKTLEAETQKLRSDLAHLDRVVTLSTLTGAIAHEVSQPLTAILNNAQAALRYLDPERIDLEEVREALKDIISDDKRARDVLMRLRALVKKRDDLREPFDMNKTIQDTVRILRSEALMRNASVLTDLDPQLPVVYGDRVQMQQVILNLIMNALEAVKESPRDARKIEVSSQTGGDGSEIRLTVSDSGPGIAEDKLDAIFEPFYTTKAQGTGLGLTVCRSIAESYRGRIQAERNAGGGAAISLLLPIGLAEEH